MGTSHKGGMLVGYARVSTEDQNLDLQKDALRKAGCGKLFTDIASGAKDERVGLAEAITFLRPGDTLVVWKLDRLGRSLKHLIETVTALQARKVGFRSLQESIDTTTRATKEARQNKLPDFCGVDPMPAQCRIHSASNGSPRSTGPF